MVSLLDRPEVERVLEVTHSLGMSLADFDRMPQDERDLRLERYERQRGTCQDCGNPVVECSDRNRKNYPYRRICYASMERAAAQAAYDALHEKAPYHDGTFTKWSAKRSLAHPYKFDEGVTIGVADHDLTPWDPFMTKDDASPVPPTGDERESELGSPNSPEQTDDHGTRR